VALAASPRDTASHFSRCFRINKKCILHTHTEAKRSTFGAFDIMVYKFRAHVVKIGILPAAFDVARETRTPRFVDVPRRVHALSQTFPRDRRGFAHKMGLPIG
jgi:hypothetical protein